ncbi:MAG TPA: helix-turn-helix domain-containing protein [Candidatus Sulfotelmatobacter sp.]|nr:helix-turn-helix domain-containing protein [Candidatus Sulfotelmatobacter sp.]
MEAARRPAPRTAASPPAPSPERGRWIAAALARLGDGGVDAVKVEALAKRLRVTKGGFYWHFKDRAALLAAVLDDWRAGRVAAIERQAARAGRDARERLAGLVALYVESANPKAAAIELAIRDWARRDRAAAAAVADVDAARLDQVAQLYVALGLPRAEADARAFLFYAFLFGQSLLFLPRTAAARRALVAACTAMLADAPAAPRPRGRRGPDGVTPSAR